MERESERMTKQMLDYKRPFTYICDQMKPTPRIDVSAKSRAYMQSLHRLFDVHVAYVYACELQIITCADSEAHITDYSADADAWIS